MNAIYITNNAFDAVVLPNGTAAMVDKEIMEHFLNAQTNGDDFSEWNGMLDWPSGTEDIWEAAETLGDIIAYYTEGKLHVCDGDVWQKRKEFWGFG